MSKTSHTSNGALEDHGTLADSELDGSAGAFPTSFLAAVDGHTEVSWTPAPMPCRRNSPAASPVRALAYMNGEEER